MTELNGKDSAVRPQHSHVIVVGAGVSGCACGVALASWGVDVTVMSCALDRVGLASVGPVVCEGPGCASALATLLLELPPPLREVWLGACFVPERGPECVVVDRRRLSVETKRALERVEGLGFRQGLVVGLEKAASQERGHRDGEGSSPLEAGSARSTWELETAFGEVWSADRVVIAVGLNLGGSVTVGDLSEGVDAGAGAVAGELVRDLAKAGVQWVEISEVVGASYTPGRPGGVRADVMGSVGGGVMSGALEEPGVRGVPLGEAVGGADARRLRELRERAPWGGAEASVWDPEFPMSPYWSSEQRTPVFEWAKGGQANGEQGTWASYPDGLATGQRYVRPGVGGGLGGSGSAKSRMASTVRALVARNVDSSGRLMVPAGGAVDVWFAGRAGGARDYMESLRSGLRVAEAVAEGEVRAGLWRGPRLGQQGSGDRA